MNMKKILWITLIIILLITVFVLKLLNDAGAFKSLQYQSQAKTLIHFADIIAGAEDLTIDATSGLAFISSDDRFANRKGDTKIQGAIYLLDLEKDTSKPILLTESLKFDFHPHGLSLFKTKEKTLLFVINHQLTPKKQSFIEVFEWKNKTLIHLESIGDKYLLDNPNDLVAVGERSFYVTNDHFYPPGDWRQNIENYGRVGYSFVSYFDGKKFSKAVEGFNYANGINTSQDGKEVYLAATTDRTLFVFERNQETGELKLKRKIFLNTGVDNIELDKQGNLWIGCHPKLLAFLAHAGDINKNSPSQILKLTRQKDGNFTEQEILLNDGQEFSGLSVAAPYQDKILVGTVFEKGVWLMKIIK
jgi:arylesterase/paraoxonase